MDIYKATLDFLLNLPPVTAWSEMEEMLIQAAARQPYDWRLPLLACRAVGGIEETIIPASAAVACLQMSIVLVDDLLDADPRGAHHKLGISSAANLAVALQAVALEAFGQSQVTQPVKLTAMKRLNLMALQTAWGQHQDVQSPKGTDTYWHVIQMKSAPFFGVALFVGALLGGADAAVADQIEVLGYRYGELIQIQDDMKDTMEVPANPDWLLERAPLPILFAQSVEHPYQERFGQLRAALPDTEALLEAQTILIRCGAISYCVDQFLQRYDSACAYLASLSLAAPDFLEQILIPLKVPIQELLDKIEQDGPAGAKNLD